MKKQILLLVAFLVSITINAQKLTFRNDGTFKIAQFTDTHICADKTESQAAIQVINAVIATEKPDLIVFTGDVVTGKPAREGWNMVLEPVVKSGIPFFVVLGNHDDEQDISREAIASIVTSCKNNLNILSGNQLADFVLQVHGHASGNPEALLYGMDSHAYSTIDTVKGYGWFSSEQINWYRNTSSKFTKEHNQKPYPALAFFHIPLPEYKQAYENKKVDPVGTRLEDECSPQLNTGMFAAFLESGDVMGTFVGHDHNNDYAASLYGITLCYGRFTGGKTTYTDIPNGVRLIELKEGERGFTTWIRLSDGSVINRTSSLSRQTVYYNAFSHNDYEHNRPLFDALSYGYNNVEADIHLIGNRLFVAHDFPNDTSKVKTLEELYLKPLSQLIEKNGGRVYPGSTKPFYLMIDFKSGAEETYTLLNPILEKYKNILCSVENGAFKEGPVLIFISGNRPFQMLKDQQTRYTFLDGRITDLGKNIPSLLMPVVSNNYADYFKWDGKGKMPSGELKRLQSFISKTHKEKKMLRFWGAPHTEELKRLFIQQGIDLIGEDKLENLYEVLKH